MGSIAPDTDNVVIDGYSLSIQDVVAVARRAKWAILAAEVAPRVAESVSFLKSRLHLSIYGVSTGFGGSADTRTNDPAALQLSLLEHQLCGFLGSKPTVGDTNALPEEIVRGAMLIRTSSLSRGHSAVRVEILETLLKMLDANLTPIVPLRGSISASGDLSPLSYIAGCAAGHPDLYVIDRSGIEPVVLPARDALDKHGIEPITLGPKEGLGMINGTAVSAAASALVMDDIEMLINLSQALTAMTVEAMVGAAGSFHPFLHEETRPHPGQIKVARHICSALEGSKLAVREEDEVDLTADVGVLRQDRYALRTSPQWLGPQLENLALARQQVEIELNSTTDNPLIDVKRELIHHGGAFQAMSLTAATESARLALANIGKLSFAQLTELLNCNMNRGLASCLAGSEPSSNYHGKGCDIHAAAYTAELGQLAAPVSTHVQSAEMGNQSVNSMALVSARRTRESAHVLTLLLATHLYCACQAVDLRVADQIFRASIGRYIVQSVEQHFGKHLAPDAISNLALSACARAFAKLDITSSMDSGPRSIEVAAAASIAALDACADAPEALVAISAWRQTLAEAILSRQHSSLAEIVSKVDVASYLGQTSALYRLVRETLGVKFRQGDAQHGKWTATIGSSISKIVESLADQDTRAVIASVIA